MSAPARPAAELLDLALAQGLRSIAVAGIGKNAGKTVVVRALCEALQARDDLTARRDEMREEAA